MLMAILQGSVLALKSGWLIGKWSVFIGSHQTSCNASSHISGDNAGSRSGKNTQPSTKPYEIKYIK